MYELGIGPTVVVVIVTVSISTAVVFGAA